LQSYTGEATMSYLSQMVALVIHNFGSAGNRDRAGRGVGEGHRPAFDETLGNFWVTCADDLLICCCLSCVVFAVFWCRRHVQTQALL